MPRLSLLLSLILLFPVIGCNGPEGRSIDRYELVHRHFPRLTEADSLSPFTVGNGEFAYTVDITGLQTFPGFMRLCAVKNLTQGGNLWRVPNLLLQKFPAPSFQVTTHIKFRPELAGEKSGLLIMGREWAYLALVNTETGLRLAMHTGTYFQGEDRTEEIESLPLDRDGGYLQVIVSEGALCSFFYSLDGKNYHAIGREFQAVPGTWIGAKVGLFNVNPNIDESGGYADFDWFRFGSASSK